MNRILLEQMLKKMKSMLEEGQNIGDLKIGALYALGNQLDAIFYFIGHELGSFMQGEYLSSADLVQTLEMATGKFHLGSFHIIESNTEHITFELESCNSCKDIEVPYIQIHQGFCSFEAGLFAGIVEKTTGKHCFAQELECRLQKTTPRCRFMIVIPRD